ncbi:MAG: RNA polymerase subunit sigma-28 [Clostridium sp.]|jgi:RNA polymerase sigma factor|uniref:sigma factor n=1 Tax=Clostridium sp. TaxID=1506 RepID=UPI0025BA83F0|nr:sigma factor [Clostridium sp.]MCH3963601.1 RNA polymerase subunit sigma-28 [Clostridium sp.]MCI1714742.1 RNA polymerase subunit sigma-28 [Clostridium sp.]MCI1799069.1 RNA polymerase subunit sigma-28 [Clostridium sp.]MCI1812925.1 RNA polymerase subunit sigma-28 [Clostridium sp.]MCI1869815.1 RNA polymerase subunit sigma-28 [Clostridium sp.]
MPDINHLIHKNRNEFIDENRNFIYKCTYSISKRYLQWENDDELSIALIAFNKACDTYTEIKGNFYTYAKVIIRNALIDYFRKNGKFPLLSFDNDGYGMEKLENSNAIANFELQLENKNRAEEIIELNKELLKYKIDFNSLVNNSPKHKDTRGNALKLVLKIYNDSEIRSFIVSSRKLPIKKICMYTGFSKKFVDKWRKYIIALFVIFSNKNFPYIRSYLNIKAGENNE